MSINNGTGSISGSSRGDYRAVLDASRKDINSCEADKDGYRVEQKFREGSLTCQQTDYFNGDTWYHEVAVDNSVRIFNTDGTSVPISMQVSEYAFNNGNTVLGYNPQVFNPINAAVNLSSGTDTYLGSINNLGNPDGTGTLSHMTFDKNGWMTSASKTGNFINGRFLN